MQLLFRTADEGNFPTAYALLAQLPDEIVAVAVYHGEALHVAVTIRDDVRDDWETIAHRIERILEADLIGRD